MYLSTSTHVRDPRDHAAAIQTDTTIRTKTVYVKLTQYGGTERQRGGWGNLTILLNKKLRRQEPKLMKTAFP